ncbi:ATP-dependent zinc metalloprotease FtsH [Microbulbifer yueqingensis]|uniref:ATP-dependent zinc metalloprotease FtsH n=1 Tax=Microbulbifer yueqingensis TaxID=658219 RepID=A0A1G9AVL3_9GAMM|nr:ATP-dependent zinc metalloprotease FtsH [Microbulbifer yueqingensis]SDK30710.1 cell division protease FtsH [Microbulbifer yueqingensis]
MPDERKDDKQGRITGKPPSPLAGYLIWALLLFLAFSYWTTSRQGETGQKLSYTEFKERVRAGEVESVTLSGENITGKFVGADSYPAPRGEERATMEFRTTKPPLEDPDLIPLLEERNVEINAKPVERDNWTPLIISLMPLLLILALFWFAGRAMQARMGGGGAAGAFGFGKSRAKRFERGESSVTFDDVAGLENAKRDLREIADYLKNPEHYRELGAKIPKGILLMGPPGTGKTLMAKALAGESDVPFFSISGSEFIEMFVGVGASRVRDMFASAKKEAPAIIFIDEIDSVGRARGTGLGGGHDEREQTLNQILGEMDGFDPHETVVVIAATNRPDVLDAALLRPGRFDRKITVDLPDKKARLAILKTHSRKTPLAGDVDLERLAALTVGFSGADLENMVNEAALLAGREDMSEVDMNCMLNARDRVVLGSEREMVIGEEEKRLIAYHESGHALAASLLPNADPLDKATIVPRGHSLGATEQIPEEERHSLRASYLYDRIGVMLGGRVAEQVVFGEVSSGAESDLKQATSLAQHMVAQWGMSDRLGPVAFRRGEEHVFLGREIAQPKDFSEHTAQVIDEEVGELISKIEERVRELLEQQRDKLDALAEALLEKETLEAAEIQAIIHGANKGKATAKQGNAAAKHGKEAGNRSNEDSA